MQENVKIAMGSPETRARLSNFKSKMQLANPNDKITMGDAIDFAIEQAEKVPELEKKIKELQEVINNSKTDDPYFDSKEFNEEETQKEKEEFMAEMNKLQAEQKEHLERFEGMKRKEGD